MPWGGGGAGGSLAASAFVASGAGVACGVDATDEGLTSGAKETFLPLSSFCDGGFSSVCMASPPVPPSPSEDFGREKVGKGSGNWK